MKLGRRETLGAALIGIAAAVPGLAQAAIRRTRFDREAYDRYIALMNAGDLQFVDYYADDVRFIMNMRGKAAVRDFYVRQRPYVRETVTVLFFCADAHGAAAEVQSEVRCIKDCDDTAIFGRALKAGEVQKVRGCLLYVLNPQGRIAEIKGPPPEVLEPWHLA